MKKTNRWLWTGMMLLFVALLMAGCSSEGGSGGGEDGGTDIGVPAEIIFKAFNSIVPIDGVITITASIKDTNGNNVADATQVTLSDEQGLVRITPASQETVDGKATFVVTGQVAGIANLICQAGGAIATISITIVDTAPMIVLSVDDTNILVGQVIEISATVMESDGTLVDDDTEIKFDLSDDQLAELDETTVLTTNGVATVNLTAREAGTVVVGATYGAGTGTLEMTIAEPGSVEPANITVSASAASVLMGSSAMITATVTGTGGQPVSDGTAVSFTLDSDAGTLSSATALTTNGTATVLFTGEKFGVVTVTATAGSAFATTSISVTANIAYLSITTSKTQVKTDNNDFATIKAIALDQNRVPVEFVPVTFSASAGQISAFKVDTDASGEAAIIFKSGAYDKENQTVTITASAPPGITASIPVQLTGTTVSLAIDNTSLQAGGGAGSSTTMTITVKDGGGVAIFDTDVTISQASDGSGSLLFKDPASTSGGTATLTGSTDVTGKLVVTVIGNNAGTDPVVVTAAALGASANRNIVVSGLPFELLKEISAGPADVFAFNNSNPDTITRSDGGSFISEGFAAGDAIDVTGSVSNDGSYTIASVQTGVLTLVAGDTLTDEVKGATVTIRFPAANTDYVSANSMIYAATSSAVYLGVRSPDGHDVRVSTSIGTVEQGAIGPASVITISPTGGIAAFTLNTPASAGIATITAEDVTDTSVSDSMKVAIAAPSSSAANIRIQASPTVIPASSGGVTNVSSLLITVTNASGEVVYGAPVSIKTVDATRPAGGEYVSPNLVYTDVSGQAESTFYSGSLVSTSTGVQITASLVINPAVNDTIAVVIGGDASSVSIGAPTEFFAESPSVYRKPMTVLVADSNGNPVNGATVNLSVWPLGYYTGGIGTDGPVYCCSSNYYYPNEDTNRNEVLDLGEDIGPYPAQYNEGDCNPPCPCPANGTGNGVLDPAKSTAGTVPATVTTDENGVAEFDFYQQKVYSVWTKVEIKASVVVYGTETIAVLRYGPNWLENESQNLPTSPWGQCWTSCLDIADDPIAWPCPVN